MQAGLQRAGVLLVRYVFIGFEGEGGDYEAKEEH